MKPSRPFGLKWIYLLTPISNKGKGMPGGVRKLIQRDTICFSQKYLNSNVHYLLSTKYLGSSLNICLREIVTNCKKETSLDTSAMLASEFATIQNKGYFCNFTL
jgi:hypothetical protein